jgi:hypothetical protein
MRIDTLLGDIDPVWHDGFRRFVDTGELDPKFETELNHNQRLQGAVDRVLDAQANAFRELDAAAPGSSFLEAAAFGSAPAATSGAEQPIFRERPLVSAETATELVALGVAAAARVPEDELRAVADAAQERITSILPHPAEAERAHSMLSNLTAGVGA